MNSFGNIFRITSFGESHGPSVGVVVDNCPPGLELNEQDIQKELERRRPGQSEISSPRVESDTCEILSGVFEGRTTGMPVCVVVDNENQRSEDYNGIKDVFRPGHADFGYLKKYGIYDYRGGGRSSGRETIARVIGGAIARKVLQEKYSIEVFAFAQEIEGEQFPNVDRDFIEKNPLRMADKEAFPRIMERAKAVRDEGDSLGGVVQVVVKNPIVGLGSPVFGKLGGELARACLSVGSTKGFEMGEGFALSTMRGSQANDPFVPDGEGKYHTERNANGGILGGISTGDDIWFRVAVKPTSSIYKPQKSTNTKGEEVNLKITGRHDPIIVPRIIPVLEAMTAMVILDHLMLHRAQCRL